MNIGMAFDQNLIRQACVTIESILAVNRDEAVTFFFILLGVSDSDIELLKKSICGRAGMHVYRVQEALLNELPLHDLYLSPGTYLRLFFEQMLSFEIEKLLYLDVDIIVTDSLLPLWNESLDGYSMAAARDYSCYRKSVYDRLGYDKNDLYFNAGVLLINLSYWRKNSVSRRALDFIAQNPEVCRYHDQDALNYILHGTVKFISNSFNAMIYFFRKDSESFFNNHDEFVKISEQLKNPVVIHYVLSEKPWSRKYHSYKYPFANLWFFFRKKSRVKIKLQKERGRTGKFRQFVKAVLAACHLRKPSLPPDYDDYFIDVSDTESQLLQKMILLSKG